MNYNYVIWIINMEIFKTSMSSCELSFGVSLLPICEALEAKSYSSTKCTEYFPDLGHW